MSTNEQSTDFTPGEIAILTPFDCLAHDVMRKDAAAKDQIVPCWLTCSAEARTEARRNALVTLRLATGILDMSEDAASVMCDRLIPARTVVAWKLAERTMKGERAEHNPLAWFAS